MAPKRINREQEYALYGKKDHRYYGTAEGNRSATRRASRYGKNVLAPPESPEEEYERGDRHISVHHVTGQSRNLLIENLILLLLLVGSIYGLYQLTVYLLNQA